MLHNAQMSANLPDRVVMRTYCPVKRKSRRPRASDCGATGVTIVTFAGQLRKLLPIYQRGESMKITGACHCGVINYQAELDPASVGICHCADCQALSASAFRTIAIVPRENFEIVKGTPKHYVKVGDSGNPRVQAFCGDCGSGLYSCSTGENPEAYNIRTGTIRQRGQLVPQFECWTRSRLDWVPGISGTTKFEQNPNA